MGLPTRCGVLAAVCPLRAALRALHPPLPGLRLARICRVATTLLPLLPYSASVAAVLCSNHYGAQECLLSSRRRPAVNAMQQSLLLCYNSPQPSPVPSPIQGLRGCRLAVRAMQQPLLSCSSSQQPSPIQLPIQGPCGSPCRAPTAIQQSPLCSVSVTAVQQSLLCNNRYATVANQH